MAKYIVVALALAGCPTVEVGETPSDIGVCYPAGGEPYFEATIWPQFLHPADPTQDCATASCHQSSSEAGAGAGAMGYLTAPPIDYDTNYAIAQQQLNCATPAQSPLLLNALGQNGHSGGMRITPSDPRYALFLAWFQ